AILMTGLTVMSGLTVWNLFGLNEMMNSGPPGDGAILKAKMAGVAAAVPVIAAAWLLAEYFCGRRRLLLPSMALSVTIVWSVATLATVLFMPNSEADAERMFADDPTNFFFSMGYIGFGAAALAAGAIFWRFRLPFSLFLVACSIAGLFYTAV